MNRKDEYPEPIVEQPSLEELMAQEWDGVVDSTDGCQVEPDGICPHGHPSWLIRLGYM